MKQHVSRVRAAALTAAIALGAGAVAPAAMADTAAPDDDYQVLVVGKTLGFRHSHIVPTTNALIALGEEHGFDVDVWDPAQPTLTLGSTPFTSAEDLSKYSAIIFNSPVDGTNNMDPNRPRLLDDSEVAAFQGYIRSGGGYVGLHAATDTLHTVPWYSQLTGGGARFRNHPQQQQATMRVENPTHPSTAGLPVEWSRFDEWYNYTVNPRPDVHVLMTLDESTYNPGNGRMGEDHPIAWCQNFEGGRSWYTGAGHTDQSWQDPLWLGHVLSGIEWAAGLVSGGGDCVTFPEVERIIAADTAGDAGAKAAVSALLASAKGAAAAGDHDGALASLLQARTRAADAGVAGLEGKVADLIVWQRALSDSGGPSDADGIPVDVSIVDKPGSLTLTVGDYGDGVKLTPAGERPDRWRYTGDLPTLTVTDARNAEQAAGGGWAASGQSTDFVSDSDVIGAEYLGWVPRVLSPRDGVSAGPAAATAIDGGTGLSTPSLLAAATNEGRRGTAELDARLVLDAPVGSAEGDYSARVTVSLFPVD
ncbi:ThuA domain-containing protein [Georgenia satyanarayanai]|uniref:ThuA domain-containing protein n=1 Tax=Georgenia satyanarayanai TaxID=860221 RepID=UPI00186AE0B7|nr:ThuA domain-containing protein [Georgenia satyanarayanai]